MEPSTHALSGAVIACTLPLRCRRWWFPLWAAAVAASPDLDVLFIHTPLQYIEYHRGITHSILGAVILALFAAIPLVLLDRHKTTDTCHSVSWTLPAAWGFAYLLILHHVWLDCMNSYGTQVFLPFSDYRVRWNALFIVDPLLLLPLLAGILFFRRRRNVMIGLLLWTFLYPLSSLGTRIVLEKNLSAQPESAVFRQTLTSEGLSLPTPHQESWSSIKALHLVPDAFTPFHWKIVLDNGALWDTAGYTLFSSMPDSFQAYSKPPEKLWKELGEKDRMFRAYQRFVVYPSLDRVIDEHSIIPRDSMQLSGKEVIFSDLRFGSTIPFVDTIQTRHNGEQINFRIMARILPDGTPFSVRFVTTTGAGGDSGWISPMP